MSNSVEVDVGITTAENWSKIGNTEIYSVTLEVGGLLKRPTSELLDDAVWLCFLKKEEKEPLCLAL